MRQFMANAIVLSTLAVSLSVTALAAGEHVCVRNFLGGDSAPSIDVCAEVGTRYVYAMPRGEGEAHLCVLVYPDTACDVDSRGYRRITAESGATLCVVDFNQPGVGNYCEAAPTLYSYAQVAD